MIIFVTVYNSHNGLCASLKLILVENADIGLTADKEETGSELLQDDDLLALVNTSKNDGDDTGRQGGSERPLLLGEQVLGGLDHSPATTK